MFRDLSQRAIEAFLRRNLSVSEGPARQDTPRVSPAAPPGSGPRGLVGPLARHVPPQAHRAPYLEDTSDYL